MLVVGFKVDADALSGSYEKIEVENLNLRSTRGLLMSRTALCPALSCAGKSAADSGKNKTPQDYSGFPSSRLELSFALITSAEPVFTTRAAIHRNPGRHHGAEARFKLGSCSPQTGSWRRALRKAARAPRRHGAQRFDRGPVAGPLGQKATKVAETGPDVVDDFPELAAVRDGELDVIEAHLGACLDEVLGGMG